MRVKRELLIAITILMIVEKKSRSATLPVTSLPSSPLPLQTHGT